MSNFKCDLCQENYPCKMKVGNQRKSIMDYEHDLNRNFLEFDVFKSATSHLKDRILIQPELQNKVY